MEDGHLNESAEETTRKEPVARPSKCNPIPLADIQMSMTNVIQDIEKLQKSVSDYRYATKGVIDLETEINDKKKIVTDQIMSGLKWVFDEGMKSMLIYTTTAQREIQSRLNPNEIHLLGGGFNSLVDLLFVSLRRSLRLFLVSSLTSLMIS